ncbi:MAG: hypothetical protein ACOCV4_04355 [Myxococcota bacterium]
MSPSEKERAAARLRTALDLFEAGVAMMRQKLRREHPDAPAEEIQRRLGRWLHTRPGAEHGDAEGRPIAPPSPPKGTPLPRPFAGVV